jgi:hypothetical protein
MRSIPVFYGCAGNSPVQTFREWFHMARKKTFRYTLRYVMMAESGSWYY